jgi:hypothetical protein
LRIAKLPEKLLGKSVDTSPVLHGLMAGMALPHHAPELASGGGAPFQSAAPDASQAAMGAQRTQSNDSTRSDSALLLRDALPRGDHIGGDVVDGTVKRAGFRAI